MMTSLQTALAAALSAACVTSCSAQADFPDVRNSNGTALNASDYTGAFTMVLDSAAAADHNADLGVPVDISLRPAPSASDGAGEGGLNLDASQDTRQYYHVELFTDAGEITRCTVQEGGPDGSYSDARCRRVDQVIQIVVSGGSAGRLIFEVAKEQDGAPLAGRGFMNHPALPVSPSIGAVTLTALPG